MQHQNGQAYDTRVGAIFHATYLKWNEEGAEAAAATAPEVYRGGFNDDEEEEQMFCNRPFVSYLIDVPEDVPEDKTSPSVLFSMVVSNNSCFDWNAPESDSMAD